MMTHRMAAAAALLAGTALISQAQANTFSIMVTNGTTGGVAGIYSLNTTTGVASNMNLPAQDPASTQTQFSPNALGVSPSGPSNYFYSTFNVSGNESFFRNNGPSALLSLLTADDAIAAGDAFGYNYYYVDRNGKFGTINNIFSASPVASTAQIFGFSGATLGDLAVNGTIGYVSYGSSSLGVLNVSNPGAGFSSIVNNAGRRYVGLGFDQNDNLFGVHRAGDNNFDLYSINVGNGIGTKVADITGISNGFEITDAARAVTVVPEPDAYGLALAGMGVVAFAMRSRRRVGVSG